MARTKPALSQPEQSNTTGTGGELHQQQTAGGALLTTNQEMVIADNQNSLKAAPRGPTLLEDFILREKITHFDHERIPERIVHARGSGAHGFFEVTQSLSQHTKADFLQNVGDKTPGLCAFFYCCRWCRFGRPAARCTWFRDQILYTAGEIRSGRQQYADFLHPGRDEVPRPRSFGQNGARPRLSAGGLGARHILGLCVADAGKHAHDHVGDVGSGDPTLIAYDRRIWRQYLSPD